jgi:hypothetical protein
MHDFQMYRTAQLRTVPMLPMPATGSEASRSQVLDVPSEASLDTASFKRDLLELLPTLRAFAIHLSRRHDMADDLVQEALIKAWRKQSSFEPGTHLRHGCSPSCATNSTVRCENAAAKSRIRMVFLPSLLPSLQAKTGRWNWQISAGPSEGCPASGAKLSFS